MRAVVQRVSHCEVTVDSETTGRIESGLAVFLGVSRSDTEKEADYMSDKITHLRIFADDHGKMNLSVKDVDGEVLVVSQFTLYGDCRKGRRPSYNDAAPPDLAKSLYYYFVDSLRKKGLSIATGRFQAMMEVSLVNDGPVTILLDSEKEF